MRGVSFSYSNRQPVLLAFDLKLEAGIKVGWSASVGVEKHRREVDGQAV